MSACGLLEFKFMLGIQAVTSNDDHIVLHIIYRIIVKFSSPLQTKGAPVSSTELLLKPSRMSGLPEVLGKALTLGELRWRLELSVLMRSLDCVHCCCLC